MTSTDKYSVANLGPDCPTVLQSDGTVFLPVASHLADRLRFNSRAIGSLLDDCYILCGWLNYLLEKKIDWMLASDDLIQDYTVELTARGLDKARIQSSADQIFKFYWAAEFSLHLLSGVVQDPAKTNDGRGFPITASLSSKNTPRGRFQISTIPKGRRRPTPHPEQVETIRDALLDEENIERAHCRWLAASLISEAGFRLDGIEYLTLALIAKGLMEEGIHDAGKPYDLAKVAESAEDQSKILSRIESLITDFRKEISIEVKEKGRRRVVAVPLELMENVLHYIWTFRHEAFGFAAKSDALFLSMKTKGGIKKKSLGNVINSEFRQQSIPGSAHRLRAAFVENVVRACYLRQRAAHGSGWDRQYVLLEAAEALGHSDTRSLNYYLNRVLRELDRAMGEALLVTNLTVFDDLREVVRAANHGDSRVVQMLQELASDLRSRGDNEFRDEAA